MYWQYKSTCSNDKEYRNVTGEMAFWVKVLAVKPDDLTLIPGTLAGSWMQRHTSVSLGLIRQNGNRHRRTCKKLNGQ